MTHDPITSVSPAMAALRDPRLHLTAGHWLTWREPQPHLAGRSAGELLALGAQNLAGNCRYAPGCDGDVLLLGEVRVKRWAESVEEAAGRLERLVRGPAAAGASDADDAEPSLVERVETALAESGQAWSRRDDRWAVQVPETGLGEITIARRAGGVVCQVVLAQWEHPLGGAVQDALATLLYRAHAGLRGSRGALSPRNASMRAFVAAADLPDGLADGLAAAAAAGRLLATGAQAMLTPEIASLYLKHTGRCSSRRSATDASNVDPAAHGAAPP